MHWKEYWDSKQGESWDFFRKGITRRKNTRKTNGEPKTLANAIRAFAKPRARNRSSLFFLINAIFYSVPFRTKFSLSKRDPHPPSQETLFKRAFHHEEWQEVVCVWRVDDGDEKKKVKNAKEKKKRHAVTRALATTHSRGSHPCYVCRP